jgi:hypothetical protein
MQSRIFCKASAEWIVAIRRRATTPEPEELPIEKLLQVKGTICFFHEPASVGDAVLLILLGQRTYGRP